MVTTTNMKCTPEEATPEPEAERSAMLLELEAAVLRGCCGSHSDQARSTRGWSGGSEAGPLLEALLSGDLEGVLRSPPVLELLAGDGCCDQAQEMEAYLEKRLLTYLGGAGGGGQEQRSNREVVVMALGVSCLQLFAQSNWTGPPLSLAPTQLLPAALCSKDEEVQEALHSSLLLDGEALYSLVANPLLLLLARIIFTKCSSAMEHLQLVPWWTLRYISLHQQILEARSPQLLELACSSMERVLQCQGVLSRRPKLAILFHLECVYINLTYYEYHKAKEHIRRAQEISGLDINMTGALGKRTRFQHKYLAQLILEVKRSQAAAAHADTEPTLAPTPRNLLPKDNSLGDDTVLDQIALQEPDEYQLPELSGEEQAVVLGVCTDFQRNNPVHKLTAEELLAFTSCLLSQPKLWAVEVAALCLRTKLERGRTRCVERAMMQTQALVDHFEDKECPPAERLKVFYCCPVPTRWAVQKLLASLMDDLGCVSSALLVYEKLELWEEAVICYERLGQHGKAEEIVRRELEKKERPSLYCLLGDILREHQYYERAWELSGQRSSRAMRSKALLHLRQKEFQQCVDCFELSLKVNAMQLGVWFSLGCAYLSLGGYEGAARAFQRCVGLEPDNAEAWNNLSTAYIRLQRKDKAFRTLQEALKCNFEHWQIWENFLVVSTDIGDFAEAIRAYHRLMDLRDAYKDVQVLGILVRAVVENLTDSQGAQALTLRSKVRELMGRVSSRHTSDPEIWRQYAALCGSGRAADAEDNDKALHFLQKAHRCEVQAGGWDKEPALFKDVIHRALEMGEVTISCSQKKTNPSEALQMLSSSRLSLRSLATKAKQMHTDVSSGQVHEDLQESLGTLEQLVTQMQELSVKLREQSQ